MAYFYPQTAYPQRALCGIPRALLEIYWALNRMYVKRRGKSMASHPLAVFSSRISETIKSEKVRGEKNKPFSNGTTLIKEPFTEGIHFKILFFPPRATY